MSDRVFVKKSHLNVSAEEAFGWHSRPGALERLTPPWEHVRIVERCGGIENGGRTTIQVKAGPLPVDWTAEHRGYRYGRQFEDVQVSGPFHHWHHTHSFEPDGPRACFVEDHIEYALPFNGLGDLFGAGSVADKLERAFEYRHRVMRFDLEEPWSRPAPFMKILVSGANGLVGSALIPLLTAAGHQVARLVRTPPRPNTLEVYWNPNEGKIEPGQLEGFDGIVHLAGESIASRWNAEKKKRIRDSRVNGTRLLAEALAGLKSKPKVLVCASAIGFYGDRGDETLNEESSSGTGFLAEVCREWENAAEPAAKAGIRTVHARLGVVLSPVGGALKKMLLPFKMGGGGVMGSGRQYWSWIAIDDVIGALNHALLTADIKGPVNLVAPHAVTNREFTKTLGRVLSRPTIVPMPGFAARIALGEMANELLLSSARVVPERLQRSKYAFRFTELEPALQHLQGKTEHD